ncbi:MAG: hypothetical protein A2Y16_04435 [Tenericutes bacterium GWF2_57_13]|nr:MAG: hypothetical protein A2Y16_04435 [Tenericutes bacterium GWF2_57_13]
MSILSDQQIKEGYFGVIGGFPSQKIITEVNEYIEGERICIACTQLDSKGYSARDQKRILAEWIEFLSSDRKKFTAIHFNSKVPQSLFDAACCQENLEELRFKWGSFKDLSSLTNLKALKYLYIGSGASVQNISTLGHIEKLIALYIVNFKHVNDYHVLTSLTWLEQLVISGPILGKTPINDLEFLRDMQSLVSVWLPGVFVIKKYSSQELLNLRTDLPTLHDVNGCIWGSR